MSAFDPGPDDHQDYPATGLMLGNQPYSPALENDDRLPLWLRLLGGLDFLGMAEAGNVKVGLVAVDADYSPSDTTTQEEIDLFATWAGYPSDHWLAAPVNALPGVALESIAFERPVIPADKTEHWILTCDDVTWTTTTPWGHTTAALAALETAGDPSWIFLREEVPMLVYFFDTGDPATSPVWFRRTFSQADGDYVDAGPTTVRWYPTFLAGQITPTDPTGWVFEATLFGLHHDYRGWDDNVELLLRGQLDLTSGTYRFVLVDETWGPRSSDSTLDAANGLTGAGWDLSARYVADIPSSAILGISDPVSFRFSGQGIPSVPEYQLWASDTYCPITSPGDVWGAILFKDTGSNATSPLMFAMPRGNTGLWDIGGSVIYSPLMTVAGGDLTIAAFSFKFGSGLTGDAGYEYGVGTTIQFPQLLYGGAIPY